MLAHVLVAKFCDHLPLYRQSEIFAREGIELDSSTLADWAGHASHLLAPLVDATRTHVLASSKIHADDTPIPVLAPGTGKTKTARLWTYVRDDRPAASDVSAAVWFTALAAKDEDVARVWSLLEHSFATIVLRPRKPRRMSVKPTAIQMRVPGGRSITNAAFPRLRAVNVGLSPR